MCECEEVRICGIDEDPAETDGQNDVEHEEDTVLPVLGLPRSSNKGVLDAENWLVGRGRTGNGLLRGTLAIAGVLRRKSRAPHPAKRESEARCRRKCTLHTQKETSSTNLLRRGSLTLRGT